MSGYKRWCYPVCTEETGTLLAVFEKKPDAELFAAEYKIEHDINAFAGTEELQ